MQPGYPAAPPGSDPVREVWDRLRAGLDERAYGSWIDGKVVLTLRDDELTVGVASPFLLAWMQRQFAAAFREAARQAIGPSARVRFEVDGRLGLPVACPARNGSAPPATPAAETPAGEATKVEKPAEKPRPARRLNDLDGFVPGSHCEMAYAAARRLADGPAAFPGPLYVYGGVGLGKTHLLEGISARLRRSPGFQVAYLTAEAFANYFTEALRNRTLPAFRARFRAVDVLAVDDVDFFDGKKGLQEEFLHTLQQLETRGKTVALSADRHPKLLTRTADDLVTRFLAGTVCRIDAPDYETRLKILARKAARLPNPPSAATLEHIARRFRGGVRELEGALNCLDVYGGMTGRPAGVAAARRVLGDLERDCLRAVRLVDIEQAVCEFFGVAPEDLRSERRSRAVSQPRMLAMFLARKHTRAAYSEIGTHFGGRNHSTVIAAERKVRDQLADRQTWTVAADSLSLTEVVQSIEARLRAS